jgi:hypothetical protein
MSINIFNYVKNTGKNYGCNSLCIEFPNLSVYFSYNTIIAFKTDNKLIVCENVFSTTTGKHLNIIDGGQKESRLKHDNFKNRLNDILTDFNLKSITEAVKIYN